MHIFKKIEKCVNKWYLERSKKKLSSLIVDIISNSKNPKELWERRFVNLDTGMDATLLEWSTASFRINFDEHKKYTVNSLIVYSKMMSLDLGWDIADFSALPQAVTLNFEKLAPYSVILINGATRSWKFTPSSIAKCMYNAVILHEQGHSLFQYREPGMIDPEKFADRVAFLNGAPNGILLVLGMFYSIIKHCGQDKDEEEQEKDSISARLLHVLSLLHVDADVSSKILEELNCQNVQKRFFDPRTSMTDYWYLTNDNTLFWKYMNFLLSKNLVFNRIVTAATLLGNLYLTKKCVTDIRTLKEKYPESEEAKRHDLDNAIAEEKLYEDKFNSFMEQYKDYFNY